MKRTDKKNKEKPLIILTAGGTGGHVYPAEALAEELTKRGYRLALVTDKRGKDNYKGKLGEIPNYAVLAGGVVGKSVWFKIKSLFKVGIGVLQALVILFKQKPVCVIGFGGYASFPCSVAAILTGTDLVIHEQNSVMSRTNRFLSRYADLIAQSFKNVKYTPVGVKTVLTGMPIRRAIAEVANVSYPKPEADGQLKVLVLGGSQGAKIFSEIVPTAIKNLDKKLQKRISVVQQCRQADLENVVAAYQATACEVVTSHFFDNMPELYTMSHLVISRSGASSVSEIAVAGVPSLLVPLPTAADDHQSGNAAWLGDVKAAKVISQKNFTAEYLQKLLTEYLDDSAVLEKMAQNAKKTGIRNAAERFADAVEKEIIKRK